MLSKTIFVDVDGVLANSVAWWLTLYNYEHMTNHQMVDFTTYDPRKCWGISLEDYYHDYRGVYLVPGASSGTARLSMYYRLVYVTIGYGKEWLQQYVHITNKNFIQVADRGLLRGYALIDDNQDNLDVFNGKTFLMKQPWNPNGQTWEEITEELLNDARSGFTDGVSVSPV